jgi:DNA-binding NarL/FixJ family response regulator
MTEEDPPIRVLLASDSFLVGDGLAALMADVPDIEVVGRARDHTQLLGLTAELEPDAVIISIRTPLISTMETIDIARHLRADHRDMGIVVISERANGFALELLRGGASRIAFLLDEQLPDTAAVIGALRALREGQSVLDPSIVDSLVQRGNSDALEGLTPREVDVLEQIAHGLSNRAVASELNVSMKAVEKYVTIIFRKLGLSDHSMVDRRVIAALTFLRTQANPFNPLLDPSNRDPHVAAPHDVDQLLAHVRTRPRR